MGLKGTWKSGMRELKAKLGNVATKRVHLTLNKLFAADALSMVKLGFRAGTDPYGAKWAPTIRGGQILRLTGRLVNSLHSVSTAQSFAIWTDAKYAATHQFGADIKATNKPYLKFKVKGQWASKKGVKIPKRPFLPENEMPSKWMGRFEKTFDKLLSEVTK